MKDNSITNNHLLSKEKPRKGCIDIWNAYMTKESCYSYPSDIPFCPCTAKEPPIQLISYSNAKTLYNKKMKDDDKNFFYDAYIHFYIDDQKFDGNRSSIWLYPDKALKIIKHFAGIITPDFSTYADFPDPIKRYNTFRMRSFGKYIDDNNIPVINNVRWGTIETWDYCFDGIPENSIVAIGTVASNLTSYISRHVFEEGFFKMIELIKPRVIIIYGSCNYPFFDKIKSQGIEIISFPSETSIYYAGRKRNE